MRTAAALLLLALAAVKVAGLPADFADLAGGVRHRDGAVGLKCGPWGCDGDRPFFCKGLDCPSFRVLEELPDNIQLRRYRASTFVATRVRGSTFLQAQVEGAKRLISYFAGCNDDRLPLPPSLPLVTALFPQDSRRSRSVRGDEYVLLAYVPDGRQDRPPRPSDPDVHILRLKARDIWVQSLPGFIDGGAAAYLGWRLIERLEDRGRCVSRCVFGLAVYNAPTELLFRHNEIWVPARRHCRHGGATPAVPPPAGDVDPAEDPADWDDTDDDSPWPEADVYADTPCSEDEGGDDDDRVPAS